LTGGVPRLFVAVWPPDEVVSELMSLRRKDQRGVRFVPPRSWHVTLRFLGDAHVEDVLHALEGVPLPRAQARLGPAVDVLAGRSLVVPVAGLDELAATVAAHTAEIGRPPRPRFVGHLTLARLQPHAPMPSALGSLVHAEFDVDEVALVRSRLHPDGAQYETVETWPTI
jgi:2'-5' RNA ligase